MKIILATGIYPPAIGGPATYVPHLAEELTKLGHNVTVITYGEPELGDSEAAWKIYRVSKSGGPLLRWRRFAKALKDHGSSADVIECFSSVSCGMPLKMAKLTKPKKILRLGGDFTWERYTDLGRRRSLRDFMLKHPTLRLPMSRILALFDHIVFSTEFQQELYKAAYGKLPRHSIIENALPSISSDTSIPVHQKHDPLRLLYFGRFVKFKNLDRLLHAVAGIPHATLTMVGDGPERDDLSALARTLQMQGRVSIVPPVHGEQVQSVFDEHDLMVIPSLTEISPNAALEARVAGLPVLLTEENGLSAELRAGMIIRPMLTINDITKAVLEVDHRYDEFAQPAAEPVAFARGWGTIAEEHMQLFIALSKVR